jgi:hypothetical protein
VVRSNVDTGEAVTAQAKTPSRMEATEGSPEFVRTTGLLEEDVVPKTLISSSPSTKGIRTWKSPRCVCRMTYRMRLLLDLCCSGKEWLSTQLDETIARRFIRPKSIASDVRKVYGSPVSCGNGQLRMCVDYHAIKAQTIEWTCAWLRKLATSRNRCSRKNTAITLPLGMGLPEQQNAPFHCSCLYTYVYIS